MRRFLFQIELLFGKFRIERGQRSRNVLGTRIIISKVCCTFSSEKIKDFRFSLKEEI